VTVLQLKSLSAVRKPPVKCEIDSCEIGGAQSDVAEDSVFLGCDAVWGEQFPTFRHIPEQWNLQTDNFLRMKRFWATFAWSEAG
jgi:hypothetical protein